MLIPAELRSPVGGISGSGGMTLQEIVASNPSALTIGIAAAQAAPSVVAIGGVRTAAPSYAPCAVAATRLEMRAGRIFGVLCAGSGPVWTPPQLVWTAKLPGKWTWKNPFPTTMLARVWGNPKYDESYSFKGFTFLRHSLVWNWGAISDIYSVEPGATMVLASAWPVGTGITFSSPIDFPDPPIALPDWRPAVANLSWANSGLPWWGAAETAAKSGIWVRRDSWTDTSRQIRYEAGAGTTRAVAMQRTAGQISGAVVTDADFGVAEFLGDDWVVLSGTEPPAIDVSDLLLSGTAGASLFAVLSSGQEPTPPDPSNPPGGVQLPASGQGFVYLKNGVATLVAAKDVSGDTWEP